MRLTTNGRFLARLAFLGAFSLLVTTTGSAKQPAPQIGSQAFEILTAFYDYDVEIPLEARAKALHGLLETPQTRLFLYDAPHRLPVSYVEDAVGFLAAGI